METGKKSENDAGKRDKNRGRGSERENVLGNVCERSDCAFVCREGKD